MSQQPRVLLLLACLWVGTAHGEPLPEGALVRLGTTRLRRQQLGLESRRLMGHTESVYFAALSPDGKVMTAGDSTIRMWERVTGKELRQLGDGPITAVHLSPDGKVLAQVNETIHLWDMNTGKEIRHFGADDGRHSSVVFSPDGRFLITGARPARLWDAGTGKLIRKLESVDGPNSLAVSPDGKLLAAGGYGSLGLWDLTTGKRLHELDEPPGISEGHLVFSPDGKLLASGYLGRPVMLWDVATGKEVRRLGGRRYYPRALRTFSPDGKLLVLVGEGKMNTLHLVDVQTGKERRRLPGPYSFSWVQQPRGQDERGGGLMDVAFSPDGRTLAAEVGKGRISLWEVSTGQERRRFSGHEGGVRCLSFSTDGRLLVSGGNDTTAVVWDVPGLHGKQDTGQLSAKELDALWNDLAGRDAALASRAIWTLAGVRRQSVSFLEERLQPIRVPESDRIKRLIADLDDARFPIRSRAIEDLAELAEFAGPALRKALTDNPGLEKRRRLELLIANLENYVLPPGQLRMLRAIEALEQIGTPESLRLLKTLAGGAASPVTQEAEESLRQLAKRSAGRP